MRALLTLAMVGGCLLLAVAVTGQWESRDSQVLQALRHEAAAAARPPPATAPAAPAAPEPIEIIAGGETSEIDDAPAASVAAPIPLFRYDDGSGAIRMVEGLENVPLRYRHSAREVRSAAVVNRFDTPAPAAPAFRDFAPELDPDRDAGLVLFSAAGCSACGRARRHLDQMGAHYQLRDVHVDSDAKRHVRRVLGRVVVPLLKAGGTYVSGYLPAEYDRLARRAP